MKKIEIIEDFETLLEAKAALGQSNKSKYNALVSELESELGQEYCTQLPKKIRRWVDATVVQRFDDSGPSRYYIQAKMLYRDGYYEASIMLSRSIAEMICYDRLDAQSHPFGTYEEVERKNFRKLIKWLHANDSAINQTVYDNLNDLYDIGNNYVHPKRNQNPTVDSLKCLHLIGESVFEVYGIKSIEQMIGRTVRSAYCDFPDINSGVNFMMDVFSSPQAAHEHSKLHDSN